jgi:hypothetical protein
MRDLIKDVWENQHPLFLAGSGFLVVTVLLAVLSLFDSTQILGINRWIKPIKFSVSAGIFLLTVAVYLFYLKGFRKSKKVIAWGTILILVGEVFLITMQAARGTTSHFNIAKPFDSMVFTVMGLMILTNTFLIIYLAFLYFRADIKLPQAVVWGMRLGLIVFILGSVQGGYLSSQTGHAVGVTDGGPGLPFLSWSTVGGDLRAAHFLGLHAFQAIPLFALAMVFLKKQISFIKPTLLTVVFAILYFSAFSIVFIQALLGKPLINKSFLSSGVRTEEVLK